MSITYLPFDGERLSVPWHRLLTAARRAGAWHGRLNEGHRTMARQQWLYDHRGRADLGIGNSVAVPSASAPHIRTGRKDHAVDVTESQALINYAASKGIRLARTVRGESWHLEVQTPGWEALAARLDTKERGDTIQRGDRGPGVRVLRNLLWHLGGRRLWPPVVRTGERFGPVTERYVKKFQRAAGLKADGVAGPLTWRALRDNAVRARVRAVLKRQAAPPPPKPPATPPARPRSRLFADISGHQEHVDLGEYAAARHTHIAIKLTEGTGFVSDTGLERWAKARSLGLARIAYHFARPSEGHGAAAEARHFAAVAAKAGLASTDVLVLDWEDPGFEGKPGDAWAAGFFAELSRRLPGVPAGRQWLYSYGPYAAGTLTSTHGRAYWHAAYNDHAERTVPGWAKPRLVAVQFTNGSDGPQPHSLPGIGRCDINRWT